MAHVEGFTNEELIASAREDAFTGLIKVVSIKEHPELRELRNKLKLNFEAILKLIDEANRSAREDRDEKA